MTKSQRCQNSKTNTRAKICTLKRFLYGFIWLLIFSIMSYRIVDWANTYLLINNHSPIENQKKHVLKKQTENFRPYLLLCNLNPIRGTRIFLMSNGSKIYDILSDSNSNSESYEDGFKSVIKQNIMTMNELKECSHRIEDMLKECQIDRKHCPKDIFQKIWYNSRMCYQFVVDRSVSQISWALDPEEYEYLIPNNGLVGFRLFFIDSEVAQMDPTLDSIIAGPLYQTNARITFIKNASLPNGGNCGTNSNMADLKICKSNNDKSTNIGTQFSLHSQYYKSPFFSQLQLQNSPILSSKSLKTIQRASLIQQRSYLRYADKGLFYDYQQLTSVFQTLFQDVDRLHKHFVHLNISINSDHRYFRDRSSSKSKCDLTFLSGLNTLMKMLRHYETYRLNFPLLRQLTYSYQYEPSLNQLTLLNMIFGEELLPQMTIKHSLQQQLNSVVSAKLQLKEFIHSNECQQDMVQSIQASYVKQLEQINSVISACISTLKSCNEGLDGLKKSADYIRKIFYDTRLRDIRKLTMKNLVTIDVEIISQPLSETLRQINNLLSKSHPLAEILGIICGTLGGSVPLLMLLEWCYRNRRKSQSVTINGQSKLKSIHVPSPSTEHIELSSDLDSTHHAINTREPETSEHIPESQRSVVFVF